MTRKTFSPRTETPVLDRSPEETATTQNTVKSDDHGAFRVHVQLLGHEWSQPG